MTLVTSSELAAALKVSPTRVGQYVREGKLAGCFMGDGRARRFDLDRAVQALGRQLHPGQMLGNGAATRKAIADLKAPAQVTPALAAPHADSGADERDEVRAEVRGDDKDAARYEVARIHKAEEEVRKLRRLNAEAEGKYVLAAEVERQIARLMAQEIAEFDAMLRNAARALADKFGLDARAVRQVVMDVWRAYRATRADALTGQATEAELTPDEQAGDI